jgi:hypothetical protein
MGWTSFSMHEPVSEWFKKEWESGTNSDYEVLDSALVQRQTLYGAVKKKSTGEIFCAVFLIRWSRDYYNFSYKDMTEHAGPYQVNCPKRIMKLLTPLNDDTDSNGWAREWRQRVNEYWGKRDGLKKIKDKIIKTAEPVQFTNGREYQYFKKIGRITLAGIMVNDIFEPYTRVRVSLNNFKYELI